MSFANPLTLFKSRQELSQSGLAAKVGIHINVLGRYERGDAVPSVEVAAKIAGALSTSLDYLTGLTDIEFDSNTLNRINEIASLLNEDHEHVFKVVDALIRDAKAEK
ncbi:helix-turn-helix transcriptional regulator [Mucilaginibacter sp. PAMB04168]|uniref:helix-turn-helix domain-containing protein n=1 Tax=Mucilaginibacter sp. PAMB04168 TaxID=3138567 RepID=UPI0031F711BE